MICIQTASKEELTELLILLNKQRGHIVKEVKKARDKLKEHEEILQGVDDTLQSVTDQLERLG